MVFVEAAATMRRGLGSWWSRVSRLFDRSEGEPRHPFDRRHRVDTSGLLYAPDLTSLHPHAVLSAGYYATAPSLFTGALELWLKTLTGTGLAMDDYTLVDVGCGKGRVVLLACGYPFYEVIGQELHPRLARIARRNLKNWPRRKRACRAVCIVEGDAMAAGLPPGPVVLYFFNSFEREMALRWVAWLAETAASRTEPIDVIYVHPEFGALLRRLPEARLVAEADVLFTNEDAAADAFGVSEDRCAIYRIGGGVADPKPVTGRIPARRT